MASNNDFTLLSLHWSAVCSKPESEEKQRKTCVFDVNMRDRQHSTPTIMRKY